MTGSVNLGPEVTVPDSMVTDIDTPLSFAAIVGDAISVTDANRQADPDDQMGRVGSPSFASCYTSHSSQSPFVDPVPVRSLARY